MYKLKHGQSIHDKERSGTLSADEHNNRLANQTLTFVWTKICTKSRRLLLTQHGFPFVPSCYSLIIDILVSLGVVHIIMDSYEEINGFLQSQYTGANSEKCYFNLSL